MLAFALLTPVWGGLIIGVGVLLGWLLGDIVKWSETAGMSFKKPTWAISKLTMRFTQPS